MKKIVSLLLVLVLVIAMATPAMALSSTMMYKYKPAGTVNGYAYSTKTGASTSKVTAYLEYEINANLAARIEAESYNSALNVFNGILQDSTLSSDLTVTAAVTAKSGIRIDRAYVYYTINSTALPTVTMS